MYRHIYDWENKISDPRFVGIDEHGITNAYTMTLVDKANEKFGWNIDNALSRSLKRQRLKCLYLKEQYTTPFTVIPWLDGTVNSDHPDVWNYIDGNVSNERDGDRSFIYLHLMNFLNSRWRQRRQQSALGRSVTDLLCPGRRHENRHPYRCQWHSSHLNHK